MKYVGEKYKKSNGYSRESEDIHIQSQWTDHVTRSMN